MLVIPWDNEKLQWSLLAIVIEKENFDRLQKADPLTLEAFALGGVIPRDFPKYRDQFRIMIAYEEEMAQLYEWARHGQAHLIFKHLLRGFQRGPLDSVFFNLRDVAPAS
jgi:hypothetical protein